MKTIGMIGGMSWESTATYYQVINQTIQRELGGLHSAKILLHSLDFWEIEQHQTAGQWDVCSQILSAAAVTLEQAGAELLLLCTNTLHRAAPQIQASIKIPFLHIGEAAAEALQKKHVQKAALLGTKYTMAQAFYRDYLAAAGIETLIPRERDIQWLNNVIFQELCMGRITSASKERCVRLLEALAEQGAQGAILGCTELGLLVAPADTPLPLFDTALLHAEKAARLALVE